MNSIRAFKTISNLSQIRRFGIIAFLFFGILSLVGVWRHREIAAWVFGALSFLGVLFMLFPTPLKPVYLAWIKIGHAIGKTVNIVILSIAYYLVITPAALLKRIFGGRPIPFKGDPNAITYWVDRNEPAQPKERFVKRY